MTKLPFAWTRDRLTGCCWPGRL